MKKLLEVNEGFEELYRMLIGPIQSKLLLTGIELKAFNHLSEPKSAEAVAEAIGAHPVNTKLFLDGLAASDLVLKKDGLYQNTEVTQIFLAEDSPTFLGPLLTSGAQMVYESIDLPKLVKEGSSPLPSELGIGDEEMWVDSAITLAMYARGGVAQQAANIISELPEFLSFKKMLDLGGGPGIYAIAIVFVHPTMKGIMFDRPAIIKVAENFIKEYEMEGRIEVMAGDYNHDPIGKGYDLIWASNALNFARHDMDLLTKKIYDALNPGGVFISFHEGLTYERTKPKETVLAFMPTALTGQDIAFNQGEIADSMHRVGFKSVRSRTLNVPAALLNLDIGRKA